MSSRDRPRASGYGPTYSWFALNSIYFAFGATVQQLSGLSRLPLAEAAFRIAVRNIALTAAWYGGWHMYLYAWKARPLADKFSPTTNGYHHARDRWLTLLGALVASAIEVWALYRWAAHAPGASELGIAPLLARPFRLAALVATCSWWSDLHFWFAHRVMHAWWRPAARLDPGAWLYRHVHAVHHKSHNPGPWTGLAMHPVEHAMYFTRSAALVLVPTLHPAFFVFVNLRAMLGPALGHHGYTAPLGSLFHFIHHAKFDYNFGTSRVVPIDHLLGTYRESAEQKGACAPDLKAIPFVLGLPYLAPLWAAALVTGM